MPWWLALGHAGRHHAESAVSPCRAFLERPAVLIDRYLIRETTSSFSAVAIILMVVFLAYSLTRFLADAAGGLLNAPEVAQLTLYKAIIALEVLLPLALYFGVIVACGRLNGHGELVALRAGGVALRRIYRPLILLALGLALAVGALSTHLRPAVYARMYELKAQAEAASELDRIKPRRFYLYEAQDRSVYVESIRGGGHDLRGIFIRTRTADGIEILAAPRGTLTPFVTPTRHRLVLHDASIYQVADEPPDVLGRFDELTLALAAQTAASREYRTKSAPSEHLHGSSNPDDRAELQWRLSTPLSTFLLTLAGLALVDQRPRQGRFARLPAAIGVYAVYYNLLGLARTWVEQDIVPHLWWAPALLALGIALAVVNGLRRQGLQHA